MKKVLIKIGVILGFIFAFILYVFFNIKPKPKTDVTVKDEKTVVTSEGDEIKVPEGQKATDVVGAKVHKEVAPVPEAQVVTVIKEPTPTPVPPTEEKSAGELLFGPKS